MVSSRDYPGHPRERLPGGPVRADQLPDSPLVKQLRTELDAHLDGAISEPLISSGRRPEHELGCRIDFRHGRDRHGDDHLR